MPFNRVSDLKATLLWYVKVIFVLSRILRLLVLQKERGLSNNQNDLNLNDECKGDNGSVKSKKSERILKIDKIPYYYPGFLLVPIPNAFYFNLDMAFWASFLYLLGSIFYVVDSFYLWPSISPDPGDDSLNPTIYFNFIAAALFILNALVCFIDWYLQLKVLSLENIDTELYKNVGLSINEIPYKVEFFINS